jgi:hypothetical protein
MLGPTAADQEDRTGLTDELQGTLGMNLRDMLITVTQNTVQWERPDL